MKCEFCGMMRHPVDAVECSRCGESLPPELTLAFCISEPLKPQSPGAVRIRLVNRGGELNDLHIEISSRIFRRPGRQRLAKLPAYPHALATRENVILPVETTAAGSQPMTIMVAFRRGIDGALCAYTGRAEIAVGSSEDRGSVIVQAEKIYAPDVRVGQRDGVTWDPVGLLYDPVATRRIHARSLHEAKIECPYCRHGLERGFVSCPGCGLDVPSYLAASREQFSHASAGTALGGVTLRCLNTGVSLQVHAKPQLSMGRKQEWNDIHLVVLPRNEINDRMSERISRDHCWLRVEQECPVLEFKSPVTLDGGPLRKAALEESGRYPIADVMALDCHPFFAQGPMDRYHLGTRITPINSGSATGSCDVVHHLLLQRWIGLGLDGANAPRVVGPDGGALCRLINCDLGFWIEPLDENHPIVIDGLVVPKGEIAPLMPGKRIVCSRMALRVDSPDNPPASPGGHR